MTLLEYATDLCKQHNQSCRTTRLGYRYCLDLFPHGPPKSPLFHKGIGDTVIPLRVGHP